MRGLSLVAASGGHSLLIAVRGPLTIAASLVAEHRLQTRRLSNYGSRAQLLRGMWDLPRPGLEPVSPALADRFSTTAPPGKPQRYFHFNKREKLQSKACIYNDGIFRRILFSLGGRHLSISFRSHALLSFKQQA